MARFIPVDHERCAATRRCFVVTRNARGFWVARERQGLIEGIFVTRRDAVRFALYETGGRAQAVLMGPEPPTVLAA